MYRLAYPDQCDFNPRSPCGERPAPCPKVEADPVISIRAPLAGSDTGRFTTIFAFDISIRAPLAGSDSMVSSRVNFAFAFQSALPLRGATVT